MSRARLNRYALRGEGPVLDEGFAGLHLEQELLPALNAQVLIDPQIGVAFFGPGPADQTIGAQLGLLGVGVVGQRFAAAIVQGATTTSPTSFDPPAGETTSILVGVVPLAAAPLLSGRADRTKMRRRR